MRRVIITRRFVRFLLIPALLGAVPSGCGKTDSQEEANEAPASPDTADIDALFSLPYVGHVTVDEDDVSGVTRHDTSRACPGYNLYGMHKLSRADLIDEAGNVLNTWSHSPSDSWEACELLPNGDLLVVGAEASTWRDGRSLPRVADDARYMLRLSWEGELLWKHKLCAHHDIEVAPDGKLALLTFRRRRVPRIHRRIDVRDEQITLARQDGTVIESRSLLEAVFNSPGVFPLRRVRPNPLGGPLWMDVFHLNSIEWMHHKHLVGQHPIYDLDNVLVCSRHQNRVAVFNWTRNEVVWAWGQQALSGPHDAQILENGHLLVFDNGVLKGFSRAIELDPVTKEIVWEYRADPPDSFWTLSKGSVQRLPNGNTLMADSDSGRAFEVTPEGEIVWEFICPHQTEPGKRASIVRIKRYPHEHIESIIAKHEQAG